MDEIWEYRVVLQHSGPVHTAFDVPPILDITVAEAGVVWLKHLYPNLTYWIEKRPYVAGDWERVR